MKTLYHLLGLGSPEEIQGFKIAIKNNDADFVTEMDSLRYAKISNGDYINSKRAIRSMNGNQIKNESNVAHGVYVYLCEEILDVSPNYQEIPEDDDVSPGFHQSMRKEELSSADIPLIRDESYVASSNQDFDSYLEPASMVREETFDEDLPTQKLNRLESDISAGGPQDWDNLST